MAAVDTSPEATMRSKSPSHAFLAIQHYHAWLWELGLVKYFGYTSGVSFKYRTPS